MNYLRLGLTALGGILVALVLYGSYQFYFKKPIPIVNNTTVQPGATLNVEQNKQEKVDRRLLTSIFASKDTVGVSVGWLW